MKKRFAAALAMAVASPVAAQAPELKLWRLDCGSIQVSDFDVFSDTYLYPGRPKQLTASCYLIKHGDQYMLWDTGVAGPAKEWVFTITLKERITDQISAAFVWLLQQELHPFAAHSAHPRWGSREVSGPMIEQPAGPHR